MKKFITIALAVAVLFSFAACQQGYKVPTGLSVSTTRTGYLVGETIDLSTVTGVVEYSDGSTASVPGTQLSITSGATVSQSGTNIVSLGYGGAISATQATLQVVGYEETDITKVVVTDYPTTATVNTQSNIEAKGTATLPDGSEASVDVFITLSSAVTGSVGSEFTPTVAAVAVNGTNVTSKAEGLENWKITIVANANQFDQNNVTELAVVYTTNNSNATATSPYIGDSITYAVYEVDGNGNRNSSALTLTTGYVVKDGKTIGNSGTYPVTDKASETYTIIYCDNPKITAEVSFAAGKSYVSSVTAQDAANKPSIAQNSQMTVSALTTYYSFTGTGSSTGTFIPTDENCVITNPTVPAYGSGSGQALTYSPNIRVLVDNKGVSEWISVTVNPISIADPSAS